MFRVHHIDIWIEDVASSVKFYQTLGFKLVNTIEDRKNNKKIIIMEINDIILEMKYHYEKTCRHNDVKCSDNKVFGLSVTDITKAKELIEREKISDEPIEIKKGILGNLFFIIHDPNGIKIEFIEENE